MARTLGKSDMARYRGYLKAELEAAAMYRALAEIERGKDSDKAEIFDELVESEMRHAGRWAEKLGLDSSELQPTRNSLKVRLYKLGARLFGTNRIIPILVRGEASDIDAYAGDPEAHDLVQEERHHARLLKEMGSNGSTPLDALRSEPGHLFTGGGNLRAAVLGINDGLVSNFSLVMGVAGGVDNPDFVLLAGVAGLLAGAFSMAAGEYISMRSQRDIYEHQIRLESVEISEWPEEEEEELALIYRAKGLSPEEAQRIAKQIMANPNVALETMAREELGLDPNALGSPWGAAFSSFVAFVAGAIVPILPYIFDAKDLSFMLSAALSAGALLVVGGLLAAISAKRVSWGAIRMLIAGGVAAAVTFGIGNLIGVSVAG